eukprot:2072839-Pyramimonas_sp.AAC.1
MGWWGYFFGPGRETTVRRRKQSPGRELGELARTGAGRPAHSDCSCGLGEAELIGALQARARALDKMTRIQAAKAQPAQRTRTS